MKPIVKGLVIAVVNVCLVGTLGAKLLYDRATLPRVWVRAAPYDPNLPIRGRYVSLLLTVEPHGVPAQDARRGPGWQPTPAVVLRVEANRLVAEAKQSVSYRPSNLHVHSINIGKEQAWVLDEPVAFFIPEHIPDPSRRLPGEQLWVETTVPKKGIPRPIRLGVAKDGGPIVPLDVE